MQFKVPQNIDMADRIVGPLTLVQFLYLLVGGIVVYFLFTTIAPVSSGLFLLIGIPIIVFSLAMAFLKIQDQPFPKFIKAFVIYILRPKTRIWHKEGLLVGFKIVPDATPAKDKIIAPKTIKKSQFEQLIQVMDTGGKSGRMAVANAPKAASASPSLKTHAKPVAVAPKDSHGR